jgi:ketosteroid isomerase-like protein
MMRGNVLTALLGAAALLSCSAKPAARAGVDVETLRQVGDRFDRAQIEQDAAALEKLVSPDLVFVGSSGVREGKKEFIASFVDPALKFEPITIADRIFMPLGPDAGVVGGDVVLRGTASGKPFASRIRFADTFRRIDGEWVAVHIQATKVSETAP